MAQQMAVAVAVAIGVDAEQGHIPAAAAVRLSLHQMFMASPTPMRMQKSH
jgi:hypothetical protein